MRHMASFPLMRRGGPPDPWGVLRRTLRWTTATCLMILASLGAATAPWLSLTLAAPAAGVAAALAWSMHEEGAQRARPPHPAVAGAWASLVPASVAGATVLGPGAAAAAAAVLALTALGCTMRAALCLGRPGLHADTRAPVEPVTGTLENLLRVLPIDVLCNEWRSAASCAESAGGTIRRVRNCATWSSESCDGGTSRGRFGGWGRLRVPRRTATSGT
jgi:hypothetical protein